MENPLQTEITPGRTVEHHGRRLTLFEKTVSVRLPGDIVHLNWKRPNSLLVSHSDGREEVLPIQDRTMQIVILIFLGGIGLWLCLKWLTKRR